MVRTRADCHAFGAGHELEPVKNLWIAWFEQSSSALKLPFYRFVVRRLQFSRRSASASLAGLRRTVNFRPHAVLHNQTAWCNQGGKFRIPKFVQQSEDVSVNRLLPKALARLEVAADHDGV